MTTATYTLNEHGEYDMYNYETLYLPGPTDCYHTTNWFYVTGYSVMIKAKSLMDAIVHFMRRYHPRVSDYWIQPQGHRSAVIRMGCDIAYEVSSTIGTYANMDMPELALATGQFMCTPTPMGAADGAVVICHAASRLSDRVFSRAIGFLSLIGSREGVNLSIEERWELRELQVSLGAITDLQSRQLDDTLNQIEVNDITQDELDIITSLDREIHRFDFEDPLVRRRIFSSVDGTDDERSEDDD